MIGAFIEKRNAMKLWFGCLIYSRVLLKGSAHQVQTNTAPFIVANDGDKSTIIEAIKQHANHEGILRDGWEEKEHIIHECEDIIAKQIAEDILGEK